MTALTEAVRCLALDAAAVATSAALRERGIESVLLKGVGLARRLGVDRRYGDVDLLVSPASFEAAQWVIAEWGGRPFVVGARPDDLPLRYERTWWLPGPTPLALDLHQGFAGVGDDDAFWRGLWRTAEEMPLAGGRIAVPDRDHAALLVALHAATPASSTRPRADLERALAVFPVEAWRGAASIAARYDAVEAYALGLRLAAPGAELATVLGLPDGCAPARWLTAQRAPGTTISLARLAELPGTPTRLRHVVRRLAPSPAMIRLTSPLARRGRCGLLLAYAGRLARHAANLPRAVRELRAARRATGR
ncbi:nucleotidyltransferase family protein [Micromonospora sp. WMMD882]|uniref:nucleotidyltransferase family protein n=1 Tax=Micromonospora sp. WMMD882 TaxID=3015151 RepID=UPI00248CB58C|nr:nucleotidyltransferase family protein [Micromonospora sp. WMMD882]WBB82078.1 nucleotidyltransferase family protein [Micromonospora sp. WMMD882]